MFGELLDFVTDNKVEMALDDEVQCFGFKQVKEVYERLARQEHFAKVIIKVR